MSHTPEIFVFGDSWTWGAELQPHELNYGQWLSQMLATPVQNYSASSTSIPHLLLQLRAAMSTQSLRGSCAIFFLSSPDRDLIWRRNGVKELHLNPSHPTDEDVRWYSQFHTAELASFRVNSSILALQKMCEVHGIQDRYIWGWQRTELWPEIDHSRIWRQGQDTIFDLFVENDTAEFNGTWLDYVYRPNSWVWPNSGHPNQAGHELIARELQSWLQQCT